MSAPIDALPLVRRITEHAYKAGALLVTTLYSDDPSILARYEYGSDASFDFAPVWLHDGIAAAFKSGAARPESPEQIQHCSADRTQQK